MKIVKRLSLYTAIQYRANLPKPSSQWFLRRGADKFVQHNFTPEQQLTKYGFTSKPRYTPLKLIFGALCFSLGVCLQLYFFHLYRNEILTRNKYRVEEHENSSILLRLRQIAFELGEATQKNLFFGEILRWTSPTEIHQTSEQILRALQYRHFMRNRDPKFDFIDLGVMDRFPFPTLDE